MLQTTYNSSQSRSNFHGRKPKHEDAEGMRGFLAACGPIPVIKAKLRDTGWAARKMKKKKRRDNNDDDDDDDGDDGNEDDDEKGPPMLVAEVVLLFCEAVRGLNSGLSSFTKDSMENILSLACNSPLLDATIKGDFAKAMSLVDDDREDVNFCSNSTGMTPLLASISDTTGVYKLDLVQKLLARGADVRVKTRGIGC